MKYINDFLSSIPLWLWVVIVIFLADGVWGGFSGNIIKNMPWYEKIIPGSGFYAYYIHCKK